MILLSIALASAIDLRLELVRESLTGTHCRYREYIAGFPTDNYVTTDCGGQAILPVPLDRRDRLSSTRWFGDRLIRRIITTENSLPYANDYDVETHELLRRIPLFYNAKTARIFDPNPVAATNNPSLQDQNDAAAAVPDSAYTTVELTNIETSGPLRGPNVSLADKAPPAIAPPDASGSLLFNRADNGFEDVNAYFHIDSSQRYLESLGYTGSRAIAPYSIETDAHASTLDNSFFLQSPTQPGIGSLMYGEGGTDDAEDADIVVHEYGHALHEWISPGTFGGTSASQARAFAEAFGDYWAFSAHYAKRLATGRDPFCFADWDARCGNDSAGEQCVYPAGADCLRRLDSPRTMADYETTSSSGIEHRNGQIMSSALREIFLALGKQVTDTIVLESLFDAPSQPTFAIMAQRMLDADRLLYNASHAATICAAMAARGILAAGQCTIAPRGEWTQFQSGEHGIAIPDATPAGIVSRLTITDTRAIEKLFVRVDIAHPSRGDLRIELVAPDGTAILLQQVSSDLSRDVHVTFGVDATPLQSLDVLRGRSAAGTWELHVADFRLRDVGTLQSWGLALQFAGDAPAAERPRDGRTQMMVIGHRFGQFDTFFASDLRLANPSTTRQNATLIFTRDGDDGRVNFSAVNVVLEPGQTVAYDDVLQSVFHTSGSGSLEILGEVIAMSRTYVQRPDGGRVGQTIPPLAGDIGGQLLQFPLSTHRSRIGVVDVGGTGATVFFTFFLELRSVVVPPYGHVQIPSFQTSTFFTNAASRVAAYVTQVDNTSGDSLFIPAIRTTGRITRVAPAVDATGVNGSEWRSDLLVTASPFPVSFFDQSRGDVTTRSLNGAWFPRVLPTQFARTDTAGMLSLQISSASVGGTRIANGATSEYVPFVDPDGPTQQHLVFIESTEAFRTNIGFIANGPATAEVTIYDSAGAVVDRRMLETPLGIAQMAVTQRVVNGRALVRFLSGRGSAYASMIDNVTGDAAYIQWQ